MSKIEVTEEQGAKLDAIWGTGGPSTTRADAYAAVANELVAMGLVRPATDDLAARVNEALGRFQAADEAMLEVCGLLTTKVEALEAWRHSMMQDKVCPPDPHAAAKDDYPTDVLNACPLAREWGVKLEHENRGKFSWCWRADGLYWHGGGNDVGGVWMDTAAHWGSRANALSNAPTVPPPGWEAAKPRTDADRLGEVAYEAWHGTTTHSPFDRMPPLTQRDFHNAAHAVRKAVLAAQLEPSEEEVLAGAVELFLQEGGLAECWDNADEGSQKEWLHESRSVLKAAARVRLEKAEEQP